MMALTCFNSCISVLIILISIFAPIDIAVSQRTRHYDFHIKYKQISRLCSTKTIPTVNGEFPGPTLFAREGDHIIVRVSNELPDKNITIHWHGIKQVRNGWADGPAYITQCPIMPNNSYTYNFTIIGQRGTLWWHGHFSWMRVTIHGLIAILPKQGDTYPFLNPIQEIPLIFGEWWKTDVEAMVKQALQSGRIPNTSDAYTINGQPGTLYPCSKKGTIELRVEEGETYMLRMVNAAMNGQLFVAVAGHKFTVVEVDGVYTKPVVVDTLLLGPGQTTNVILTANYTNITTTQRRFYLAARPYIAPNVTQDNTTAVAIITYGSSPVDDDGDDTAAPLFPSSELPAINNTAAAANFTALLRSLNSAEFPANVPLKVDRHLFFTVGLALLRRGPTCNNTVGSMTSDCMSSSSSSNQTIVAAAFNNISFVLPQNTALLQSAYFSNALKRSGSSGSVITTNFPDKPPAVFNYTGIRTGFAVAGTKLSRLRFNQSVELVLQGTSLLAAENHPIHLHGYNFFVVGQGFGNFDSNKDPKGYNLVDPVERNTVGVPRNGWVAIRFRSDNPGVWFLHCHLELHTTLGLDMAFLVENGPKSDQSVIPPPSDLPTC